MPRHNRRAAPPQRSVARGAVFGGASRLEWRGEQWLMQPVTGGSGKTYRCPGCDQEIRPGTGHVVAWPEYDADDRRHWHTQCWAARDRRTPGVVRARNAPRYGRGR
ncbi:ATP/GTP-binding protein [Epidermidibacterium keratini]|uniref:ATP/GTP-binding protein n=1 Tax=Epidermidibacterium keratini TaxID=1891644 RepID=A0A7L4YS54_9ACTN|nr:ATP/GTP-binding protein [Epidermidibacterium keratini]QHC01724.1 ATP/GTP-binding protein [Epidermidibacterium keratini]